MNDKEIEKEIKKYLDIQAERFTHELGFVLDGIKAAEERLNKKIESEIIGLRKELKQEIREVRQELIAHRDNTEVHMQRARPKELKIKKRA